MFKCKRASEHIEYLRKFFQRMRHHQIKLNLLKCTFGVCVGNFLGFLVQKKEKKKKEGIEVDHNKSKVIVMVQSSTK